MDVQVYRLKTTIHPHMLGIPMPDEARKPFADGEGYRVEGLTFTADLPQRGSNEAAGYDVYAYLPETGSMEIRPLETVMVPTGLFLSEDPLSVVLVCSRSGLASKGVMVANGPGIIDSDYRGEIKILLTYIALPDAKPFRINHGERVAQLLFMAPGKVSMDVNFIEVEGTSQLRSTRRGTGGFGSTGV